MVSITKWRWLVSSALGVFFILFLAYALAGFVRFERATVDLPRLFLQLERAIGYGGFIHNFKNFVLRPDEDVYFEAALENYRVAELTIQKIDELAKRLQISTSLEPVVTTLRGYRAMLDDGRSARNEGLSIRLVDERIRISDATASSNIRQFQQEINLLLDSQYRIFAWSLGAVLFTCLLAGIALGYIQYAKRREAERFIAALAEKSAFIQHAERIAKLGGWTIESDGRMTWSQAAMDICGVNHDDFAGSTEYFWSIVPATDRAKLRVAMNKAVESGGQFDCIHSIHRPDDTVITVVNSGEATLNADGKLVSFIGVMQDITRLTDMEDKLRQSQKMEAIGNLAGGMAHDFNNILAVVLGNLDLLQITSDPEKRERYVNNAVEAARNGANLTRSMLSFARRSPLEPMPIQLNDMIRDVVKWSGRLLPASIEVETSLLANLWQVEADRNLAQSALLNLLVNARDAMADGGKLTIETANVRIDDEYIDSHDEDLTSGRYVMLAISDTGEGMDELILNKIFDPFFSTKPSGKGSGLGLSMVLGFMKQSEGTVRVYSEVGIGTTFKLYFKVSTKDTPEYRPTSDEASSDLIEGSRVLLVEDNLVLLETLDEMLTEAGMRVTTANTGDDALATWSAERNFDLVITDIVMPGNLQGTHLAKAIRKQDAEVPFIFMSGYANEATVHGNGLQAEDTRLMKPINRLDLLTAIAGAMRGRRSKQ